MDVAGHMQAVAGRMGESMENTFSTGEKGQVGEGTDSKATFIVQIQYRQNATWQGQIVWKEKDETKKFRSELELIKLIDSAAEHDRM